MEVAFSVVKKILCIEFKFSVVSNVLYLFKYYCTETYLLSIRLRRGIVFRTSPVRSFSCIEIHTADKKMDGLIRARSQREDVALSVAQSKEIKKERIIPKENFFASFPSLFFAKIRKQLFLNGEGKELKLAGSSGGERGEGFFFAPSRHSPPLMPPRIRRKELSKMELLNFHFPKHIITIILQFCKCS